MTRRTMLNSAIAIMSVIAGVQYLNRPTLTAAAAPVADVASIAKDVADGVGHVTDVYSTGNKGTVIVLPEFHTSRPGRVESAVMLCRLYKRYNVKDIGLEGAYQSATPLDGSWFQRAGGAGAAPAREDIAVQMLSDGEINQAEFMMLLYPDIAVHGTERADEHPVLTVKGNPEMVYLLGIAEKSVSAPALRHVEELLQSKKNNEAIDYLLKADPWVRTQYESLKDVSDTSLDNVIQRIRKIEAKASTLNVEIEPASRAEMQQLREFYELRSKASGTMVDRVARLAAAAHNAPIAMIIGAAHTQEVTAALKREGIAYAVASPNDLDSATASLNTEQFDRKQSTKWAWNAPGTLGRLLNGESNSPPITQTATGKSYANMSLAGLLIARAARANKPLPGAVLADLGPLDGVRIDKTSFSRDGNDVIYRAWLKDVNNKDVEVWARVGTTATPEEMKDIEQKLLAAQRRMRVAATRRINGPATATGSGGRNAGGGTTTRTSASDHPERDHKGGHEIVPLGPTALAVFGNSRQDVGTVPRISG